MNPMIPSRMQLAPVVAEVLARLDLPATKHTSEVPSQNRLTATSSPQSLPLTHRLLPFRLAASEAVGETEDVAALV